MMVELFSQVKDLFLGQLQGQWELVGLLLELGRFGSELVILVL